MVTSRELADVVGDAIGISRESAQLHLKTIRVAGWISFKGYGRAAAAMNALDASRLLIASVGSTFAKDSLDVLKRFSGLKPVSTRRRLTDTLEDFLAKRIEELAMNIPPPFDIGRSAEWQQKFGSRRPAETALQLLDPVGIGAGKLPRYAIVRWIDHTGQSKVIVFGPEGERSVRGTEIYDLTERFPGHRLFQIKTVARAALIDIAAALKDVPARLR
ncbi:hypothetical protein V1290_004425 [Bradyrhizobium sp. AZCC 1578]|uniref:hypothetical protein n=1 Tax=Bradyrhizobium sp. AZCC 1578 TaxID=3117027 RepID=UPI002FF11F85